MTLVSLAWRNLLRRPMRTVLTVVGVGLAVGCALALIALSHSIEDSTRVSMEEHGTDLAVTQHGANDLFGGYLSETLAERLEKIRGVQRISSELFMFAPSERNRQVILTGWPEANPSWKHMPIRDGRTPQPGERHVAVIGDLIADALNKRVGDTIELLGTPFKVIGISKYASVINRGEVLVPLKDLQELTYRKGQVTMFSVTLPRNVSKSEVERVRNEIAALDRVTVSTPSEVLQNDRNVGTLRAVSQVVTIIALIMGVVSVLNTLLMSTQERTREIGIVAAVGWSDRLIMGSILLEGLLICAFGCAIGVVLSFLASFLFHDVPTIGDYLEFKPSLGLILPTVLATFALCAAGSLYPAWRAVRMTPAEALQRV